MTPPKKSGPGKIRAAVFRAIGLPLQIESLELDGPRDDEVLVRIEASGVCHTDISYIEDWGTDVPVILGHEGAGIVEQAGKKISGLKKGDHVVLSFQSCGNCPQCRKGRPAHCRRFMGLNFGFSRADGSNAYGGGVRGHFFGQSSFATHALATERNAVKVAKDLPLRVLAPLGCGLQTGAGTVLNSLGVPAGSSIAVFGTGSVGLAAIMAAKIAGAHPVIGIDIRPARLKLAKELGATHAINSSREDVLLRVQKITGKGIDYTVETSGDDEMYNLSLELLNPRGIAALLTGAAGPSSMPGGRKSLSIIQGDADPQVFIPRMIGLYREGRFPFDRLEKAYKISEINRAIVDSMRGRTIKPVLLIDRQTDRT